MKYYLLTVLLFIAFIGKSQEPAQADHEKKVYLNDGNTYVQKGLPLYLKFSTSPAGENYDLKSKATAKYADPMYLDTEGINYIRSKWAVDPESKKAVNPAQEVLYELYADGLAPNTSSKFSGAPVYRKGKTFYGAGLQVDLTSRDGVSGVNKIHFTTGSSFSDYGSTINMNTQGEFTLNYYAHDNVGNAEKTRSKSFVVDLTSPSSNHTIDGIVHNSTILSPSTLFKLSSTDALSGVNKTYYTYDGGSDRFYGSQASMNGLKDGGHTLVYYAIDNVKNSETKTSFSFYLDRIAPETDHAVNGDQFKGKYLYISPRTTVSLSATDNKAGVKNIYYRIDGGERANYASNISMPSNTGLHTIKFDANDNVENLSGNTFKTFYMDNETPETGITYGSPQFFKQGELFINNKTKIKLRSRDGQSGVQKTEYSIDGAGMKDYAEFTIDPEGPHNITFKATDNINNVETVKESKCHVDNTPPEIYYNFSIEAVGSKSKDGKEVNIYPNYTRIYLGATDEKVGNDRILYSLDDGPLTDYSSPQTLDISELPKFKKKKFYTMRIVARDKLGNESEKTVGFYIGRAE